MSTAATGLAFTEPEHLVRDFASRGIVVLPPERLGVAPEVHERIFRRKKELVDAGVRPTARNIPDIVQVLSAPGLVAACNQLAGDNWAIVPFASGAGFASGARDQHWHKDDNSPLNGRKQRHHQAVQVEMLYFPQAVGPAMGPTATMPYSQYWTFNHEDNHDNFAGADHLDFAYQIERLERVPVSGPDSPYDAEEIVSRRTAHDIRMRKAVTDTGWPLVRTMHDAAEPKRIGAAYQIALCGDKDLTARLLGEALYNDRESVRRAATYGLVALGPAATEVFLQAVRSPVKWVRKAGVYGLGDAGALTEAVLQAVAGRLRDDPSVYVRSVAAGTLGCLVRRAVAAGQGVALIPACVTALAESLGREPNRPAMDRAQGRSIKFTRPTDDCDVCEGGAFDPVHDQFAPVRSAVRENALWSLVIAASHGTAVIGSALEPLMEALHEVVRSDQNLFCVGSAMDALARLTHLPAPGQEPAPEARTLRDEVIAAVNAAPVRPWDSLVCSGFDPAAIKDYADRTGSAKQPRPESSSPA